MAWLSNNVLYEPTVFNCSNNRICGSDNREVKKEHFFSK